MSVCDECGTFCSPFCGGVVAQATKRLTKAHDRHTFEPVVAHVIGVLRDAGEVAAWQAVLQLEPESPQQLAAFNALDAELAARGAMR